jgi:hypothetical protein
VWGWVWGVGGGGGGGGGGPCVWAAGCMRVCVGYELVTAAFTFSNPQGS